MITFNTINSNSTITVSKNLTPQRTAFQAQQADSIAFGRVKPKTIGNDLTKRARLLLDHSIYSFNGNGLASSTAIGLANKIGRPFILLEKVFDSTANKKVPTFYEISLGKKYLFFGDYKVTKVKQKDNSFIFDSSGLKKNESKNPISKNDAAKKLLEALQLAFWINRQM